METESYSKYEYEYYTILYMIISVLRYKFWLTNGEPWDFLHYHYSADEFYILPILMVYGFLNLLLLIMTFRSAVQLRSRQLLHTTFKLFWSSVLLQVQITFY